MRELLFIPRHKISLLDRAKADLKAAKHNMLLGESDEVVMDISAYLCSQCAEKVAKYTITLEGNKYVADHRTDMYLQDLNNPDLRVLIEEASFRLDAWFTTICYARAIKSSKKAVEEVIVVCEKLIALADKLTPAIVTQEPLTPAAINWAKMVK